jgi:hypothetical protein
MTERLDPGFSLFNCHKNDANPRARAIMREFFPKWLDEVEGIERDRNGIMAIREIDPITPAIACFMALVTYIVNGDTPAPPKSVNTDISDLFFNTDHESATKREHDGKFLAYDCDVLLSDAREFLANMERLDVPDLPTADQLVDDFLRRV